MGSGIMVPPGDDKNKNHIFNVARSNNEKDKVKIQKEQMNLLRERKRLEELIEKKIEEADRKEEKRKAKSQTIKVHNNNNNNSNNEEEDTSIIPTIPLKEFVESRKAKDKKISFFGKLKSIYDKRKREKLLQKEQEKIAKERKMDAERIESENKKQELLQKKQEKKEQKRIAREEKQRLKQESRLLKANNEYNIENENVKSEKIDENKLKKVEEKRLAREKKEEERLKKEEEKKQKYKEKYEEQARRKREKEEKNIIIINERREKEKRLKKEKDQARNERKEKALLIKKAQEESKARARQERKKFKEKVTDWYNNLSFVRDRRNRKEMQRQTLLIDFEGADAVRSEEKIMYKYVAKNNETGKVETGMFAAFSKLDVHSFLLAEGYEVYEITPQKNFSKPITLFSARFKPSELDFFLTQLSTFLRSGITLVDSVKILSKQCKKQGQKNVYKSIIYELTMGENFSEALSKQGTIFPRLLINMIKTSELTGDLPETLDDMADYYREIEKTKKQMISAITYPAFVLCFAIAILIFIMVKVIPQFVSIYSDLDAGLPAITVAIIKISNFLQTNWVYVLLGIAAFILLFIILFKTIKVFKTVVQSIVMNLPIMGKIIIYNEVTMFTKTFASLLNHNVYITDCMEVLSKITNNEVYKMLIFDTITNLAKGEAISNSFKNQWAFPNIAYEMILTGEKTGQLGPMMDKVANYYQELHKNAVGQIKAFIEPVMIIILAGIVGVVLLSVVFPMFDMYQNIGA